MTRIDSHQHFWSLDHDDYGWLTPALEPIYRDFAPRDLAPALAKHAIDRTILVQAAPAIGETLRLLQIAQDTEFVSGVVGWVDFEASTVSDDIAYLKERGRMLGLRPMVQDIPDDDWLLRDSVRGALHALVGHRLTFDALVLPRHLPQLGAVAKANPDLPIVIDHCAKPEIANGAMEDWARDIAALGELPNVYCKLSGLVTEASASWKVNDLARYARHVLACFGADRVMWGSDWPVVNLAGGYDRWMAATGELLADRSEEERKQIMGGTAARFYGIEP
ncbi:MAG: amidohydrolase family protein [Erythrobacter sp.]|uniref:amidohydrolase family protein n=1 Tax=Erythrobacter sp. TaxID=1042 RepID=UPI00261741F3|nr:amidohydrolase family protein [Erythrobacter sp.]MDJ0978131.1 amidohydrolase family protein [Erythrobacter sp.]